MIVQDKQPILLGSNQSPQQNILTKKSIKKNTIKKFQKSFQTFQYPFGDLILETDPLPPKKFHWQPSLFFFYNLHQRVSWSKIWFKKSYFVETYRWKVVKINPFLSSGLHWYFTKTDQHFMALINCCPVFTRQSSHEVWKLPWTNKQTNKQTNKRKKEE